MVCIIKEIMMSRKTKLVLTIILLLVLLLFGTYRLAKSRTFQLSGDLIYN